MLVAALETLFHADVALAQRLDALLAEYRQAPRPAGASTIVTDSRRIDTGGGAYIDGNVDVGGDFVGRDSVSITGDGNVVGDHSSATVIKTQTGTGEVEKLFARLLADLEARTDLPPADKEDVAVELDEVQAEVAKGERADEGLLARRLRNIGRMAPDILDVVLTTLANPVAGVAMVARKVAQRMKAESESASS